MLLKCFAYHGIQGLEPTRPAVNLGRGGPRSMLIAEASIVPFQSLDNA